MNMHTFQFKNKAQSENRSDDIGVKMMSHIN